MSKKEKIDDYELTRIVIEEKIRNTKKEDILKFFRKTTPLSKKQEKVYKFLMDNPCLSEEIDYESEDDRSLYYYELVRNLSNDELNDYIEEYEIK